MTFLGSNFLPVALILRLTHSRKATPGFRELGNISSVCSGSSPIFGYASVRCPIPSLLRSFIPCYRLFHADEAHTSGYLIIRRRSALPAAPKGVLRQTLPEFYEINFW